MKYNLVIFDLDGTILDTLEDLYLAVNFSLEKNSLPVRTKEEVRRFVGNGIRLLIERAVPDNTASEITDKVFSDFKDYYSLHSMDNTIPYDGINEMLNELRKLGVRLAVVSNKADFAVQKLVDLFFEGMFDFVLGEKESICKKPAPDMVVAALDFLGMQKTDAVYIGDSEVDIETAANSVIDSIIVTWGFRDRDFLEKNGGVVFVDNPKQLIAILK